MDVNGDPFRTDQPNYGASEGGSAPFGETQESVDMAFGGVLVVGPGDSVSGYGGSGEYGDVSGSGMGGSNATFGDAAAMDLAMFGDSMAHYGTDGNGNGNTAAFGDMVDIEGGITSDNVYGETPLGREYSKHLGEAVLGTEGMDVDESPQFTIELELFFDLNKNLVFGPDSSGGGTGTTNGTSGTSGTSGTTNYRFGVNTADDFAESLGIQKVPENAYGGAVQDALVLFFGNSANANSNGPNYGGMDQFDADSTAILGKEFATENQFQQNNQPDFIQKHDILTDVLPLPQLQQYTQQNTQPQILNQNQNVMNVNLTQPQNLFLQDHPNKPPFFVEHHALLQKHHLPQLLQQQYQQHLVHQAPGLLEQRRDGLHEHLMNLAQHGSKRNSLVLQEERGHPHANLVLSQHSQHHNRYKNQLHRGSIDSLTQSLHLQDNPQTTNLNELSPLTTTTSLTPSVSSMHSTQPSFLSAQQYFSRNSFDQVPPAPASARGSLDLYTKNRQSIDSQQSGNNRGRYTNFTTSLYNYFPFRSDRNQLSPVSNSSSPNSPGDNLKSPKEVQPAPPQQLRMLIRSIFRSQNNTEESQIPRTLEDELEQEFFLKNEEVEPAGSNKKVKKPRRGLFTRFKPLPKEQLMEDGTTAMESRDSESLDNSNKSISKISSNGDIAPSSLADKLGMPLSVKEEPDEPIYEPDYAALFQKVGRRKVYPSYKKTTKLGQKTSQENINGSLQNSIGSDESSQVKAIVSNDFSVNEKDKDDDHDDDYDHDYDDEYDGRSSIAESHVSRNTEVSGMSESSQTNGSTLASASKRILGSKLMLMKKAGVRDSPVTDVPVPSGHQQEEEEGVEVEVDLKSLKLPANTQVYSTVKSKNKTRGRKENKEADMVDTTKIFLCNYCSRRFKRQEHLKRHFRSLHTYEKPYDCPHCHKKFSRLDNLNLHLKTHKREGEDDAMVAVKEEETMEGI